MLLRQEFVQSLLDCFLRALSTALCVYHGLELWSSAPKLQYKV